MSEQLNHPPPSAMVLDRCIQCGNVQSEAIVRVRDRTLCPNCDYAQLPNPWEVEIDYESPICPECASRCFLITMQGYVDDVIEEPQIHNFTITDEHWCPECGCFHLEDFRLEDIEITDSRCADCKERAWLDISWHEYSGPC